MRIFLTIILLSITTLSGSNIDSTSVLKKAPSFYAPGLNTKNFFLSKHVGEKVIPAKRKPVLLSFFTTSCVPCRQEIPYLEKVYKQYNL